jgi:hypothetical protein
VSGASLAPPLVPLVALFDRPGGRALSKRDLIAAAHPYVRRYRCYMPSWWTLYRATYSLHPSWVHWKRNGNRIVFTLLPCGRAILDRQVRAHILGVGPQVPASCRL